MPAGGVESLVVNEYYQPHFILTSVAGALTAYDLPDLYALIAPRKLLLVNPADQNGKDVSRKQLDRDMEIVKTAFAKEGRRRNWTFAF